MTTLREDGLAKVRAGETTLAELGRVARLSVLRPPRPCAARPRR